jgi:hypothetical protein
MLHCFVFLQRQVLRWKVKYIYFPFKITIEIYFSFFLKFKYITYWQI